MRIGANKRDQVQIAKMAEDGLSAKKIGKILNIKPSVVANFMPKNVKDDAPDSAATPARPAANKPPKPAAQKPAAKK